MKRAVSIVLVLFVLLTTVPLLCVPVSAYGGGNLIEEKIEGLRATYPENSYWEDGFFHCGWQCYGFGRLLAEKIFGSHPENAFSYETGYIDANGWMLISDGSQVTVEPGDIIQTFTSGSDQHTALVRKVDGDTIYVVECWGGQNNKIAWGYFNGNSKYSTLSKIRASYSKTAVWKHPSSGYIAQCIPTYPCYATIKITEAAPIRSLPCNENTAKKLGLTSDEHFVVRNAKVGEYYTAIKILYNTEGNYWYEVKWTEGGIEKTGYIYSARTAEVTPLWNDVWIDGATKPSQFLVKDGTAHFGDKYDKPYFGIAGTVKTEYTEPDYIWAEIKDANGTVVVSSQDNCYLGYSLSGKINNELVFGNLPAGNYTYEVKVQLKSYIVENNVVKDARTYTATALRWSFSGVDPTPVKYTVYLNGGSLNPVCYTKEVYGGSTVGSLPTVEISGYTFDGWYTDPTAGKKVTENHVIYGNTNLYARYEAKWYKIFLSEFSEYINLSYGSSFADLPTPSKDGYIFDGWYTDPEGGLKVTADTYLRYAVGTYARTARSAVASELMPEEGSMRITLYPHWSIVTGSGVCGDNLYWEIDEDGVLTITGTGKMYDYPQATDVPWNVNRAAITEIVLPSGMTSICDNAFSDMENVRSVEVPYTVESIGDSAFADCARLNSASIYSKDLKSNLSTVFTDCGSSFTLYGPEDSNWTKYYYYGGSATCSHEYEMDFVAPTCVDDGYDRYICAMCGDEYHENYVDATGEHFYVYNADGNRIVESCINGCDHEEYATVTTEADWYFFVGDEIEPAEIHYTDDWVGDEAELFYENNAAAGIATASIRVADVTAFTNFTLEEPQVLVEGYCGDNLVWSIREDGMLFIECDGEMPEWENATVVPWTEWIKKSGSDIRVREVVVSGNITSIGPYAFWDMKWLESVLLPDTIKRIGERAFYSCFDLSKIALPEELMYIGSQAFYGCESLSEIGLPDSLVSIDGTAFDACEGISSITLGANVSNINPAFWYYDSVFDIASLKEIEVDPDNPYYTAEDGVLYNADRTVLIRYPEAKRGDVFELPFSVKVIEEYAFEGNRYLEEVHVPYNVESVGRGAFNGCYFDSIWFYGDALDLYSVFDEDATDTEIYYVEENTTWPLEDLADYTQLPFECTHESIADRVIEETCIEPGYYSSLCQYCGVMFEIYKETPASGIHELIYSASYSTITEQCVNCDHMATVWLKLDLEYHAYTGNPITPASVVYSENWLGGELAIAYTQNIEVGQATAEIEIGDALVQDVFYIEAEENFDHGICGDNLTWILTPDNILTIRGTGPMYDYEPVDFMTEYPFWMKEDSECYADTVIIEEGVTSIGAYAFYQNGGMSAIHLPDSITSIGESAFYLCVRLKALDLPENLSYVGEDAFSGCSALTTVEFPSKWTTIPGEIFKGNSKLTSVKLPENLYEIGPRAFMLTGLTSIELPDSLAKIGVAAFYNTKLESVTLPANVEVEGGAFESCVTEVYVCTDLPNGSSEEVFVDLEYLDDNKQVTVYCADPEADWFKQDWELIEVELWQPEDHVNAERFVDPTCGKGYTFYYCEYCGNGYKTDFIDSVADHDLSYYAVGDTIVETCDNGCGHKETARVSVTEYYHTCIREELSPAEIVYSEDWQGGIVTIEYRNNIWAGIADALAIYQTARAETQFLITEAPVLGYGTCGENLVWRFEENGTLTISGKGAMDDFSGITNSDMEFYPEWIDQGFDATITTVVVEDGATSIGDNAFAFCDCVRSVVLGADIESIGEYAFYETYMKSIPYLPKLTNIKQGAFAGCYNLQTISVGKNLQAIEAYAFGGCDRLAVFAYDGNQEEWSNVIIANEAALNSQGNDILTEETIRYHSISGVQANAVGWIYDREGKTLTLDNPISGMGYAEVIDETLFSADAWNFIRADVEHVYIGAEVYNVTSIPSSFAYPTASWFSGFDNLLSFEVSSENDTYAAFDGILYDAGGCTLILCPAAKEEAIVPVSVNMIQYNAFDDCHALKQIAFLGEAPDTDHESYSENLFPKSADVRITYYSDTATTGWHEYPWKSYNSIGINRFITPSMNYGGGELIIEVDTTTWEMYDKPVVLICAIYDEAGKMLETSIAYVTYDKQQFEFSRNDTTTTGQLFLLTDWENAAPLLDDLSFEIVSN